jgi:hypothetical protein
MKILLVQPPVRDFYQTGIRTQPIGLAYLAGTLKKHHHEIEILDCQPPGKKTKLPIPDELSYMKQYYTDHDMSPFRLYGQYYHFGLSWQTIKEYIDRNAPQAVGISCQFTPYFSEVLNVASIAKSCNPHVPVIVGGSHASSLPREVLKSPYVDYVVLGESEETLPQLIQSIESVEHPWHIDGVGF